MVNLQIIAVATHRERMFDCFVESCKRHKLKLKLLGFGQKWRGFGWRWTLIKEYLMTVPASDIIVVTDAFDTLVLKTEEHFIERFQQFGEDVVFSTEPSEDEFWVSVAYYRYRIFGPGPIVNGGTYMGTAKGLLKFIDTLTYDDNTDDQRLLTKLYKSTRMTLDKTNQLFYHHVGWRKESVLGQMPDTCLITFPGDGETNEMIQRLGYDYKRSQETWGEAMNLAHRRLLHYGPFFWREWLALAVVVALFVLYRCII